MHSNCIVACLWFFFVTFISSYPVADEDVVTLTSQSSQEIYDKLKSGDPRAWEEAGPYVVDMVNAMIDNGEAKSPVHALLRIFWPELTSQEQTETLERVEPLVRNLYRGLWNEDQQQQQQDITNDNDASSSSSQSANRLYKRNPENIRSLKEALKNLKYDQFIR